MTNKNSIERSFLRSHRMLFALIIPLVIVAALAGWISESVYQNNPTDLFERLRYYDLSLMLVAVPVSIIALILIGHNNKRAMIFSLGITIYLAFSYAVTLFICIQNSHFLIYVAILSLCGFYVTKGFSEIYATTSLSVHRPLSKVAAIVLLFSAISGFGYWLMDAIAALSTARNEMESLHVNPPQVFDMAIVLPLTLYGAIQMLRYRKDGILISLTTMIFFVFIGISVIIMEIALTVNTGTEMDYGKVYSYSFISAINLIMTVLAYRNLRVEVCGSTI